ncbi:PREDICTED: ferritin light chain 1-like [Elephantulus edwardii]|uniref:ferritin light chain 1-like n=1 Tax=Elephantulus edwardii TaxID=28737 RepID=UPI0003F07A07|nr:PREDICTED: ferritin light chain 1-like [Elephantulus edwardii]
MEPEESIDEEFPSECFHSLDGTDPAIPHLQSQITLRLHQQLTKENCEGAKHLLKLQNQSGGHTLFQDIQKPSQDKWGKTLDTMEIALAVVKNQALLELHAADSDNTDLHIYDFLKNHFLEKDVKLLKCLSNQH